MASSGECITCGHSHCKGRPFAGPCPERVERPRKASEPSEWAKQACMEHLERCRVCRMGAEDCLTCEARELDAARAEGINEGIKRTEKFAGGKPSQKVCCVCGDEIVNYYGIITVESYTETKDGKAYCGFCVGRARDAKPGEGKGGG